MASRHAGAAPGRNSAVVSGGPTPNPDPARGHRFDRNVHRTRRQHRQWSLLHSKLNRVLKCPTRTGVNCRGDRCPGRSFELRRRAIGPVHPWSCVAATVEVGRPQGFQHGGRRKDDGEPRSKGSKHFARSATFCLSVALGGLNLRDLRAESCFLLDQAIARCAGWPCDAMRAVTPRGRSPRTYPHRAAASRTAWIARPRQPAPVSPPRLFHSPPG